VAVGKISTDTTHRPVPRPIAELLVYTVSVVVQYILRVITFGTSEHSRIFLMGSEA